MTEQSALLERCRKGDSLAWEALVRQYQSRIYGLAFHYVRDAAEARDLAQEIFIQVYSRLDKFSGDAFVPWLLRLARNRAIDHLRRRKARPPADDVVIDEQTQLADHSESPEDAWVNDRRKQLVHRAIGEMTDQNREMILLKEIQGMNFKEIAEMLQVPLGTVKSRSHRARLELADTIMTIDPGYGQA
jgi:RNA polymerase sigma-70 factor (ECF subfamily)